MNIAQNSDKQQYAHMHIATDWNQDKMEKQKKELVWKLSIKKTFKKEEEKKEYYLTYRYYYTRYHTLARQ